MPNFTREPRDLLCVLGSLSTPEGLLYSCATDDKCFEHQLIHVCPVMEKKMNISNYHFTIYFTISIKEN